MTWCGELLLVAALAGDTVVPPGLEARVRETVARQWRVEAEAIRLAWGRRPGAVALSDSAAFRLLGRGDGGRWVVVIQSDRGRDVAVSLRAGSQSPVWVATRSLPLGATVTGDDVARETRLHWGPPLPDAAPPLGWEVRRALRAGDQVAAPAVVEPPLIRSGETVRFVWRHGSVAVMREGVAAQSARRGEVVSARESQRGTRLVGVAIGRGLARLGEER